MSWPLWVLPLLFLVAPELLLQSDSSAVKSALIILATTLTLIGVQTASAGWLVRPLAFIPRAVLYANFGLLVLVLHFDYEVLMAVCIGVVLAVGATAFRGFGTASEAPVASSDPTAASS